MYFIFIVIEERGIEWFVEWFKRFEKYFDWLSDKEKVKADIEYWKVIVEKFYFTGMGIDWVNIRNVMDMRVIYGGYGFYALI